MITLLESNVCKSLGMQAMQVCPLCGCSVATCLGEHIKADLATNGVRQVVVSELILEHLHEFCPVTSTRMLSLEPEQVSVTSKTNCFQAG